MMLTLLLSPLLTAHLIHTVLSSPDAQLPLPPRYWLVWLSALLAVIGSAIDNIVYAVNLAEVHTLSRASVYLSAFPNLLLTLAYCLVQVT
jgi:hypothetical protein